MAGAIGALKSIVGRSANWLARQLAAVARRFTTTGERAKDGLMPRLKGLDEFAAPASVGRMDRVARRRRFLWRLTLAAAAISGGLIGLMLS